MTVRRQLLWFAVLGFVTAALSAAIAYAAAKQHATWLVVWQAAVAVAATYLAVANLRRSRRLR